MSRYSKFVSTREQGRHNYFGSKDFEKKCAEISAGYQKIDFFRFFYKGQKRCFVAYGCSEILLRPNQFCNLTEVVCRVNDKVPDLKRKIRLATILGTIQATMTNFGYLRKRWTNNTEEERLLGVSLTGITDCRSLNNALSKQLPQILTELNF